MNKVRCATQLLGLAALALGPACAGASTPAPEAAVPAKPAVVEPAAPPAAAAPAAAPAAAALSPRFGEVHTAVAVHSAQAYIDGAGFHAMAEALEAAKEVKSGDITKARNVMAVVGAAPWPGDLAKEKDALLKDLKALEVALIGNKGDEAAHAAKEIHESQHDLTKATFAWLGRQKAGDAALFKDMASPDHLLGCVAVQSAQAYIDRAGFHAMAEALEKTKDIKSGDVTKVRNVAAVAGVTPWPAELSKEQQQLAKELKAAEAVLVANKVEEAMKALTEVHEAEHDLSQATFAWLGKQRHDQGAMMTMIAAMSGEGGKMMQGAMRTAVGSAQAYIDSAGFHDMAEAIEKTGQLESGYVTKVRNVATVAGVTPWPGDLSKEQQQLAKELKAAEAVLVANKPEEAMKALKELHEAEHDLSKATFAWLGKGSGGMAGGH